MKFMRRLFSVIGGILVCIFLIATGYAANVPYTLNYQGYLTDGSGQPVSGTKNITLSLYDTASGGTAFWNEPQSVTITLGRFSVVLGGTTGNPLDPSKFTGTTYIGIKVESDPEMAPRQQLTSVAYAFRVADAVPRGVITMWSGEIVDIPAGWALCDGQAKTALDGTIVTPPDLRDRFIIGAGNLYIKGAKAGNSSIDLSHFHATANHTLTVSEMPSHTHIQNPHKHTSTVENGDGQNKLRAGTSGDGTYYNATGVDNATATNQNTGGGAAHNHGNTDSKLSSSQSILPPYYALAFIMKL